MVLIITTMGFKGLNIFHNFLKFVGRHQEPGNSVELSADLIPDEGNRVISTASRLVLETTQSPVQWVLGGPLPGVKRAEREVYHWPSCSA